MRSEGNNVPHYNDRVFGSIKSNLRALGKPTGEVDALIAATAIVHQAYSH